VSTYYRKSAGLSLAAEVAHFSLPHYTCSNLSMLVGILLPNFDGVPLRHQLCIQ